jgi:hypothetical protein
MYSFKGFVTIPSIENRNNNAISPVGELSPTALTFSMDIKNYPSTNGEVVVQCYSSKSTQANNTAFTPPPTMVNKITDVALWIKQRQTGLVGVELIQDFTLAFNAQWATSLTGVDIGPMVNTSANKSFPSYIAFAVNAYTTESNIVKLWFANTSFENQYDEFTIKIVPPLAQLSSLLGNYSAVSLALASETQSAIFSRIQTARGGNPETILLSESFDYFSVDNPNVSTPTWWSALVYGPRGDYADAVRAAVVDYIATNSPAAITQWKQILPDIYRTTEFVMIPNWGNMAVLDKTLTPGIYSQIVNLQRELAYLRSVVSEYTPIHVTNNAQLMAHPYKNLLIGCIGNVQNRGNKYAITDFYPDLLSVSTTSPDFGRMNTPTQGLVVHLSTMVSLAETMTQFTDIPAQYRKLVRNGILYITVTYENVTYLVGAKSGLPVMA